MDKSHTVMERKGYGDIDDTQHDDLSLASLGQGNGQFHQGDYVIGVVQWHQDPIGKFRFTFRLLDFEHLGHIGGRDLFEVYKINKQADDNPGQGNVPRPGIKIELVDCQKHVEDDGGDGRGRVQRHAKPAF